MDLSNVDTEEGSELFGTETMAELCARQGRLGEAIKIYQKLIAQGAPADKLERWGERCRSLERARAVAPDLAAAPTRPTKREVVAPRPDDATVVRSAPALVHEARTPVVLPLDKDDITAVEPMPTAQSAPADAPAPAAAANAAASGPTHAVTTVMVEEPHRLPMVITQPVRSGQVVYAAKNDLIVLAPVNPGGQVVADGNIHVYGALRGRAIAGAQGATDARIFCQRLEAELLAISGVYLIWDDIPRASLGKPAQVSLQGHVCLISPL